MQWKNKACESPAFFPTHGGGGELQVGFPKTPEPDGSERVQQDLPENTSVSSHGEL